MEQNTALGRPEHDHLGVINDQGMTPVWKDLTPEQCSASNLPEGSRAWVRLNSSDACEVVGAGAAAFVDDDGRPFVSAEYSQLPPTSITAVRSHRMAYQEKTIERFEASTTAVGAVIPNPMSHIGGAPRQERAAPARAIDSAATITAGGPGDGVVATPDDDSNSGI